MAAPVDPEVEMAMMKTALPRRFRRMVGILACVACAGTASPAFGALDFSLFPERDFVEVAGLASGDVIDIDLFRNGQLVGQAHGVNAVSDGAGGFLAIVNHPGPPDVCWEQSTPDVLPGDVVRATVTNGPNDGTVEEATVSAVTITQGPTEGPPGTVTVKGTAPGSPPLADLEVRLVSSTTNFSNDRRDIRAPGVGTLAYDAPAGDVWTATFAAGLTPDDVAKAVLAEAGVSQLVGLPGGGAAATTFEFGVLGGPQIPGCPEQEVGPKIVLSTASDSGSSASDRITQDATPTFTGTRGSIGADPTVNLYDGTTIVGTTTMEPNGSFIVTPLVSLSDGLHQLRAGHIVNGPGDVLGPIVAVRIDTTAPAAPFLSTTNPASPGAVNTFAVTGTAEAGSLVRLHTNPACAGDAVASGTALVLASSGFAVTVGDNTTTRFYASAEDVAGNRSGCSPQALRYDEVTPAISVVSARVAFDTKGKGRIAMRCRGLFATKCTGRIGLVATLPAKVKGKKAKKTVIGVATYEVVAGRTGQVRIVLSAFGRNLLAKSGKVRVTPKPAPTAGSTVGPASRPSVLLVTASPPAV